MKMKKNHLQRSMVLGIRLTVFTLGVGCLLWGLSNNVSAFVLPGQILADPTLCSMRSCRLGAIVKPKSIQWQHDRLSFTAQDHNDASAEVYVEYQGVLPTLFKEGTMMLAEGSMNNNIFQATRILAKHDENYQPPI